MGHSLLKSSCSGFSPLVCLLQLFVILLLTHTFLYLQNPAFTCFRGREKLYWADLVLLSACQYSTVRIVTAPILGMTMERFSIATFNVNGLNIAAKRRAIFQNLRQHDLDLCCLQETHGSPETIKLWQWEWGGQFLHSNGQQNARGVAILAKKSLQLKVLKQVNDQDGRILLAQLQVQGNTYTIGSLYAPTQDKSAEQISFLDKLEECLDGLCSTDIIL